MEKYLEVHATNGFEQAVKEVTRVCETTQTFLDHFNIKNILIFGVEVLEDHCSCDHFPVLPEWHMRISHQANMNMYRVFSIIKTPEGIIFLNQVLIGELKHFQRDSNDVEGSFSRFNYPCSKVLAHLFPIKEKRLKHLKPG